ncbi:hypothetical protein HHI36_012062 [Cryptolaemus montrouzieri]|uniref:DUF4817 domain-containing protein n=1 Tax=Cryptolaemus montrouzieri TaxID=559131 RepID=A0ABD2NDI1_9CUCU
MVNFINAKLADIHYMYGLADGNKTEARRLHQVRFPNQVTPDRRTFANIHRRLMETELRNRIITSCDTIRNTPGIFQKVRDNMRRRTEACILAGGGYFQQFI